MMKKLLFAVAVLLFMNSCSLFNRAPKTGCPTSGAAVGAEKLAAGDPKAMRASSKSKYKGRKSLK